MSVGSIISVVSVIGVVLTAIGWLQQTRTAREQRHEAGVLRDELRDIREIVIRQARDVPADALAEMVYTRPVGGPEGADYAPAIFSEPVGEPPSVEMIARLPDLEKIVISLYYYDHLTFREIAEVLGNSETVVRTVHAQAIARLQGPDGQT